MTRPAPQPGETPEPDGNPWASADPGAEWWRGDTAAHPIITPTGGGSPSTDSDADGQVTAGVEDDDAAVTGPARAAGAADLAEAAAAGKVAAHDSDSTSDGEAGDRYDEPTDDVLTGAPRQGGGVPRIDPPRPTEPSRATESPVRDEQPTRMDEPARTQEPARVHGSTRTTEPLRAAQPVRQRPVPSTSRDRAASHQATLTSRLEASPFWLGGDSSDASRSATERVPGRLGVPPRRMPLSPRRPATGLMSLVLVAMVATFFAWVSAEPLWLAVGHGERGTATVTGCTGTGVGQRCRGDFTADGAPTTVSGVALLGVAADRRTAGSVVPARMVSADSLRAYASASDLTLHLRWAIGVTIVLLSGLVIAATTGARRLETARARRTAVLISIAGPLVLLAGFLAVTY